MIRTDPGPSTALRSRIRTLIGALCVILPLAVPAAAQVDAEMEVGANDRDGLWWSASVGGGGTRLTCDLCQRSRDLGPTLTAALGAHASDRLRIGIEAGGWTHEESDDTRETAYRLGLIAHLAPNIGSGLYLLGGFGWSGYRAEDFRMDAPRVTLGLGWDLPLARRWVIGNELALDGAAYGSLQNDDILVDRPVGMSTVRFSVQVRYQ